MVETGSLCYAGRLSLYCFLGCSALVFTVCAQQVFFDFTPDAVGSLFWGSVFYYIILNVLIRFLLKGFFYQVWCLDLVWKYDSLIAFASADWAASNFPGFCVLYGYPHCDIRSKMLEAVGYLRHGHVKFPLWRVFGDSMVEPSIAQRGLFHFESFCPLRIGRSVQLGWVPDRVIFCP